MAKTLLQGHVNSDFPCRHTARVVLADLRRSSGGGWGTMLLHQSLTVLGMVVGHSPRCSVSHSHYTLCTDRCKQKFAQEAGRLEEVLPIQADAPISTSSHCSVRPSTSACNYATHTHATHASQASLPRRRRFRLPCGSDRSPPARMPAFCCRLWSSPRSGDDSWNHGPNAKHSIVRGDAVESNGKQGVQ